jgi:hypothetical protein
MVDVAAVILEAHAAMKAKAALYRMIRKSIFLFTI